MTDTETRRKILQSRLAELEARLYAIEDELESHESTDWEERAVELENDEVLEGMGLTSQAEIGMIKAALARIKAGDYGFCAKCGEEIAEKRLDVLPFTPLCRNCAT